MSEGRLPRVRLDLHLPLKDNQTTLKLLWQAIYFVPCRLVFPTSLGTLRGWRLCPICLISICVSKPKHSALYGNKQGVNRGRTKDRCFSFLPQFPRLCQFHLHIQHDALLSLLLLLVSESQRKGQCPPPLPPRTAPPWPKNQSQMFSP